MDKLIIFVIIDFHDSWNPENETKPFSNTFARLKPKNIESRMLF